MSSLKLLSVLLDYPREALWEHGTELQAAVRDAQLPAARQAQLAAFVDELLALEPMVAQERWLALFDRGRSLSLLLFEHIHGESRDRGQAMVDLVETYRSHGFEVASSELPDYLPLLLEYLAQRPDQAADWLRHTAHILELLAARAAQRDSSYTVLFETLVEIGQGRVDLALLRRKVASEERDDTPEMMDRVWEEEAIRFGAESPEQDCSPPRRLPEGVRPADARPAETRTSA